MGIMDAASWEDAVALIVGAADPNPALTSGAVARGLVDLGPEEVGNGDPHAPTPFFFGLSR
jgi:hypothetical protein